MSREGLNQFSSERLRPIWSVRNHNLPLQKLHRVPSYPDPIAAQFAVEFAAAARELARDCASSLFVLKHREVVVGSEQFDGLPFEPGEQRRRRGAGLGGMLGEI